MNKLFFPLLFAGSLMTTPVLAAQQVDMSKSEIRFTAKQMNVAAEGRFRKFVAKVDFDPANLAQSIVSVDVDIASIDIGSRENETELKSKAWFNAPAFPVARFSASQFKAKGNNMYEASGKLSIKGISRDITFPFSLQQSGTQHIVSGSVPLKRLAFNVGEGAWSDTDTVADDVLVKFRLTLQPQSAASK
jgi:polyisoprenoid-binding protein YceI